MNDSDPIRLRDPATPARRKSGSSESVAVWGALTLVGIVVGAYAVMRESRPEAVPQPAPAHVVVADPEPRPAPTKPASTPKRLPSPAPIAAAKSAPVVVHHVEPEKKFVDPIEGFDSGEAFDNPPSPGRYGQRSSGLLERSPAPARPNRPDPSFGRTPQ